MLVSLANEFSQPCWGGTPYYRTLSTLPTVPPPSRRSPGALVVLLKYTRQYLYEAYQTRRTDHQVQMSILRKEHPQPTGILKKNLKNTCTDQNTLVASSVFSTSGTDLNTRINSGVQESSTDSVLQNVELVGHGVVNILRSRTIRSTTDPKPIQSFQNVLVSTYRPSVNAIALSSRTLNIIPQTFRALKSTATMTSTSQRTVYSSRQQ